MRIIESIKTTFKNVVAEIVNAVTWRREIVEIFAQLDELKAENKELYRLLLGAQETIEELENARDDHAQLLQEMEEENGFRDTKIDDTADAVELMDGQLEDVVNEVDAKIRVQDEQIEDLHTRFVDVKDLNFDAEAVDHRICEIVNTLTALKRGIEDALEDF